MKTLFIFLVVGSFLFNPLLMMAHSRNSYNQGDIYDGLEESVPVKREESRFVFTKVFFEDRLKEMAPVSGYFEEILEKKFHLFNDSYTDNVPLGPGSLSTRTVIRKPIIYSTINKIYKHFKSECKRGNISIHDAQEEWDYILEVGLTLLYYETEEFEYELRQNKSIIEKIALIKRVELSE